MRDVFQPVVYILSSGFRGTLYVGATSNLLQRLHRNREGLIRGFTRRYGVTRLVWHEAHDTMPAAGERERRLKEWRRAWKIELIERDNLQWNDLALDLGFPSIEPQPGTRLRGNDGGM